MVKKFAIVFILMLAIFMISCGSTIESSSADTHSISNENISSLSTSEVSSISSQQYSNSQKKTITNLVLIPSDNTKSDEYNNAVKRYNEIINQYEENLLYGGYLYDLTKDGIPEIIFWYPEGNVRAYSYIDGYVIELELPPAGGGDGGNTLLADGCIMGEMHKGYDEYWFYTYNTDGSANKVNFGQFINFETYNDEGIIVYDYKIEGNAVSREEYESFTAPYMEKSKNKYWDSCERVHGVYSADVTQLTEGLLPVVKRDNTRFDTVSITFAGGQLMTPEYLQNYTGDIRELEDVADKIMEFKDIKYIKSMDLYTTDSTNYANLNPADISGCTTGDWNPIVSKTKYTDYSKSEEKPKDYWIVAAKQHLDNCFEDKYKCTADTPVVITESWTFDYNGRNAEIITACNLVYSYGGEKYDSAAECDIPQIIPQGQNFAAYEISLLIVNGKTERVLESDIERVEEFTYPAEGLFVNEYSVWQYDEKGETVLCPMFTSGSYNLREMRVQNDYLYLDVDGDGMGEIIERHNTFSSSWLPGTSVLNKDHTKVVSQLVSLQTAITVY